MPCAGTDVAHRTSLVLLPREGACMIEETGQAKAAWFTVLYCQSFPPGLGKYRKVARQLSFDSPFLKARSSSPLALLNSQTQRTLLVVQKIERLLAADYISYRRPGVGEAPHTTKITCPGTRGKRVPHRGSGSQWQYSIALR